MPGVTADLCERVREHCADVARTARFVRIDPRAEIEAGGVAGLDSDLHFLEGGVEEVARHILVLDAVNFGSGWLTELFDDPIAGTIHVTERLARHARAADGP
jgi:hypothetical protein